MKSPDLQARVDALSAAIRDVPDFPKKGIVFKDITTLLKDPVLFRQSTELLGQLCDDLAVEKVFAIESRGFILGALLAQRYQAGFVPVRKKGKLPSSTVSCTYDLEYGTDCLEVHEDAVEKGERVLIVDDVIATGGTARATAQLVEQLGGRVAAYAFLVELSFLNGRDKLKGYDVRSLLRF